MLSSIDAYVQKQGIVFPHANISSGLILWASSLVERGGAYFHALTSGMRFIIPVILRSLFSPVGKTENIKLTGPFQIYPNPKASLSSGYLLRSLMRTVAMRRMLERILIIQVSNTSKGSSFHLVSTYLQIMSSGCPRYHK